MNQNDNDGQNTEVEDAFSALLGDDVKPIKTEQRVNLAKDKDTDVDKQHRRVAAAEQSAVAEEEMSDPIEMIAPLDVLSFQRPGVQHGVFKNLRTGKYSLDARLDLHRMTVEHARRAVTQFIKDCVNNDVRSALITHGKGEGREKPAMLKSCVAHWLPQMEEVLAFHSAQKQHGSYGATYVLVKKSDKKKLESKEQNRRSR